MRQWLIFWAFVITVLCNLGCLTSIAAQYPHLDRRLVCLRVPGVESEETEWIYDENGRPISAAQPSELARVAPKAATVFEYDPMALPESVQSLPPVHRHLTCPAPFAVLPSKAVKEWLPEEVVFFADEKLRHQIAEEQGCSPQVAAAYLGNQVAPPKVYAKDKCMAPKAVSARDRAILNIEKDLTKLGAQYGTIFGEAEGAIASVNTALLGTLSYQIRTGKADVVGDIYLWLAGKLDTLPPLPIYEDPDYAAAAIRGFESGFGTGFDAAIARAHKLDLAAEAALALAGNAGTLAESLGAKLLRAALTRVRAMPIFIPGTVGGVGFFLRVQKTLPKPPPANVNAPSLPQGIVAPPVTAPPPFGKLSRAAEFGIQSYTQMINALKGTGLQAHHLIEQRLAPFMQNDARLKLTVAVTDAEHQAFTNMWRQRIPYGSTRTLSEILTEAKLIYKDHPALLQALGL